MICSRKVRPKILRAGLPSAVLLVGLAALAFACAQSRLADPSVVAAAQKRVAEARLAMESVAAALEMFRLDAGLFPVSTTDPAETVDADRARQNPRLDWSSPTFRGLQPVRTPPPPGAPRPRPTYLALTTPLAYLSSLPADPFARVAGRGFAYHSVPATATTPAGWIIWSPGPDGDYDLDWKRYSPAAKSPAGGLPVNMVYDPTNGWLSNGDICRILVLP